MSDDVRARWQALVAPALAGELRDTSTCDRCGQVYKYARASHPGRYCTGCRPIVAAEQNRRSHYRTRGTA